MGIVVAIRNFSLSYALFCTVEFVNVNSAVFLSTLMTSQIVKKTVQMRMSLTFQWVVDGGLFHWRALKTFYTAQHQTVSFIEWFKYLTVL